MGLQQILHTLATALHNDQNYDGIQAAIKMLTKLVEKQNPESICQHLADIMPGLLKVTVGVYIPGKSIQLWPKPDPGLCTSNEGRFLKAYWINMLDNF